jgi:hypothetical protein
MDNNFSKILDIFKQLDEGMTKEAMWQDAERMSRDQFCDKWGDEHGEFWDNIMGELDEGSMTSAEHHKSGPEFGGYWKGTDPNPPKPGQGVGGMEESAVAANYVQGAGPDDSQSPIHNRELSLEEELMAEWDEFIREAGANNPAQATAPTPAGTPPTPAGTPAPDPKDAQAIKSNLQSLKSKVPGLDVNKATAALTTADAQQPLDSQQNAALSKSLAGPLADVVKNPQLSGQLTQLINKGQQTATAQQKQQQAQQQQPGGTQ